MPTNETATHNGKSKLFIVFFNTNLKTRYSRNTAQIAIIEESRCICKEAIPLAAMMKLDKAHLPAWL